MASTQEYLIDSTELITLPDIYLKVKNAIEDKDIDIGNITKLIEYDPAITARLLRVSNSPLYGQIAKIDNVKKAISLLGTRRLHDLVLAITISQSFQSIVGVNYDITTFWQNAIKRASVAKSCAIELGLEQADNLFVSGLLSDIGHMVMSIQSPKLMQRILVQHRKTGYPLYLFERSTFGFDYAELGADLLESWSIPDSIVVPIRHQNCPEISDDYRLHAAILYCGGRLQDGKSTFPNMIDIETLKQADMPELNYETIMERADKFTQHAISLFPLSPIKKAV